MDEVLISLRELNRRFLALAARQGGNTPFRHLAGLDAPDRAAAADCPYALFDLHFGDEAHWSARLGAPVTWQVADAPPADPEALEFVRLALFYVWHVAATAPLRAPLLVGMSSTLVAQFARQTVDRLPALAAREVLQLRPRWHTCDAYWNALLRGARSPGSAALRRAQLCGIQYAAVQRLAR
jgi:hypothetical protein